MARAWPWPKATWRPGARSARPMAIQAASPRRRRQIAHLLDHCPFCSLHSDTLDLPLSPVDRGRSTAPGAMPCPGCSCRHHAPCMCGPRRKRAPHPWPAGSPLPLEPWPRCLQRRAAAPCAQCLGPSCPTLRHRPHLGVPRLPRSSAAACQRCRSIVSAIRLPITMSSISLARPPCAGPWPAPSPLHCSPASRRPRPSPPPKTPAPSALRSPARPAPG